MEWNACANSGLSPPTLPKFRQLCQNFNCPSRAKDYRNLNFANTLLRFPLSYFAKVFPNFAKIPPTFAKISPKFHQFCQNSTNFAKIEIPTTLPKFLQLCQNSDNFAKIPPTLPKFRQLHPNAANIDYVTLA